MKVLKFGGSSVASSKNIKQVLSIISNTSKEDFLKLKEAYPFMFSEKFDDSFWLAKKEDTLQIELFNEVNKTFSNFENIESEIDAGTYDKQIKEEITEPTPEKKKEMEEFWDKNRRLNRPLSPHLRIYK